jgi:hypothetical protein
MDVTRPDQATSGQSPCLFEGDVPYFMTPSRPEAAIRAVG